MAQVAGTAQVRPCSLDRAIHGAHAPQPEPPRLRQVPAICRDCVLHCCWWVSTLVDTCLVVGDDRWSSPEQAQRSDPLLLSFPFFRGWTPTETVRGRAGGPCRRWRHGWRHRAWRFACEALLRKRLNAQPPAGRAPEGDLQRPRMAHPPGRTRSALRDQPRGAQPFAANSASSARRRSTVPTSVQRPRWCCPVINPCAMKCFCSGTTENFGGSRRCPAHRRSPRASRPRSKDGTRRCRHRSGTALRGRGAAGPAHRVGSHRRGVAPDCRPAPGVPGPAARAAAWRNRNRSRYRRSPPGTGHRPAPAMR